MLAAVADSTIEQAYIMLLDMTIILYFIPFLYMFAALPVLRKRAGGNHDGVTLVPGGNVGLWLCSGLGFAATLLSIILSMIPPDETPDPMMFMLKVVGGCLLFIVVGLVFYHKNRKPTESPG
jgi:amino acid transporter